MATSKAVRFEIIVTRSFGSLNEGERFEAEPGDEWVAAHQAAGLLKEVPSGQGQDQAREG